jgi:hypothetical protein
MSLNPTMARNQAVALSKKYTDESLSGGGIIKGKNCTIDSITDIVQSGEVVGKRVTFAWYLDDGTSQTSIMDILNGNDGRGISNIVMNENEQLVITYTDSTHDTIPMNLPYVLTSVVSELPLIGLSRVIYLMQVSESANTFSMHMYIDGEWCNLGNASVDLSNYYTKTEVNNLLNDKVATSEKGAANGVAELDSTGKVPSSQLPPLLTLGETSSTAYRGDRGKAAYEDSQANKINIVKLFADVTTVTEGDTATAAHSVDDLILVDGDLYEAITAIAIGDSIVSGTNVLPTTLAQQILTLAQKILALELGFSLQNGKVIQTITTN